jgi:putative serine protease PepD
VAWGALIGVVVIAMVSGVVIGAALKSSGTSTEHVCATNSVATRALPSVVTIQATGPSGSGTGSGEVVRSDGYILTNNHVISVAANGGAVRVLFDNGVMEDATITGRDPQTDLAVLKVPPSENLKVIPLGTSASLKVGQPVVALGAPLGLSSTVTSGIVSALDRTVQVPGENDRHALLVSAVQTDAAINPGNSGGALVDCDARLVGVPTAGATVPNPAGGPPSGGSIGLGFAIPVDLAKTISSELISSGTVSHAYFGMATVPITEAAAARSGFPQGLYVGSVDPTGPSAAAGIRVSDVITTIDDQPATTNLQLEAITLTKKPGDTVKMGYVRNGQAAQTTVTLAAQP